MAKELGLQIGKSDAPQLAVEKAAAGKGKGGKGKKAKDSTTPAGPPLQQAQHDPIKVLNPLDFELNQVTQQPAVDFGVCSWKAVACICPKSSAFHTAHGLRRIAACFRAREAAEPPAVTYMWGA